MSFFIGKFHLDDQARIIEKPFDTPARALYIFKSSANPVEWEATWRSLGEYDKYTVRSKHFDSIELLLDEHGYEFPRILEFI